MANGRSCSITQDPSKKQMKIFRQVEVSLRNGEAHKPWHRDSIIRRIFNAGVIIGVVTSIVKLVSLTRELLVADIFGRVNFPFQ
jgi:hypothetical protein